MGWTLRIAVGCALAFTLVACGEDFADGLPGPPADGEWIEVLPGGDTICSRGTEYRFFVRGGDPDKVIIDFQGGGACWDPGSCGLADALFSDSTGELDGFLAGIEAGAFGGIFESGEDLPFNDWTIIHIPYCTGDIHWGNSVQQYTDDIRIEHRGFVNATAALDWIYARYDNPENVMVSGCSAGAYGAALHSAYVANRYPDANVSLFADSGAGIITDDFLENSFPNWNAEEGLPDFLPALTDTPIEELTLPDIYVEIGRAFPDMRLAQTATAFDQDQIFFFTAMGGDPGDWPGLYRDSLSAVADEIPNFRSYVPPGSMHCAGIYPFFHTREVDGVNLSAWTEQLAIGSEMPESVACEGLECCDDPVCEACLTSDDG